MKMVNNTIRKYIYIDKDDKRLFRLMIVSILSLFVVALTTPYEANAESGQIELINHYVSPLSSVATVSPFVTPTYTNINFDIADFNQIEQLYFNFSTAEVNFAHDSASTTFTISSCGSGGGTASYSKSAKAIVWYFTNPSTVTCSPIVLSYTTNIFSDISFPHQQIGNVAVSSTNPAWLSSTSNDFIGECNSGPPGCPTDTRFIVSSVVDSTVINNYNVTYQAGTNTIFTTSIDKSPSPQSTKVLIENATGTPVLYPFQGDSSFNTNPYNVTNTYGQGIALNMTLSSGLFERVIVNSTGSTITITTPTPTPTINPGTGAGIIFDKQIYHVNDFGTISTAVDNTGFLTLLGIDSFRVDFFSSKRPLISQFDIDLSQSTQQFSVLFSQEDSYTAILVEHNTIFGTDTILATATAQAIKGTSFVQVNSSVPVGVSTPVTVQFGVTPCALNDGLLVKFLNPVDGLYYKESSFVLSAINTTVLAGVPYTFGVSFNQEGTYLLQLYDFCADNDGILASATTKSVLTAGNITNNITVSGISINNQNYSFGDTMSGHYIIDSFNYSHYNVYLDNFNFNFGYNTMMQPLSKQERDFYGTLVTSDASCFAGDCVIYSGQIPTDIGLNRIRLLARNATSTFEIVGVNYTVSNINNQGYGLTISKTTVCPNEFFFINATIPSPSLIVVQDKAGTTFKSYNISNSTAFPISLSTTGNYEIQITDLSHNVQMQRIMNVTACATPTATPITGGGAATDVTNLLSSNIFWAFILTFGMMASVAILTKGYNSEIPVAITGVLGISAFSTIGWMPWWLTFSVIILIFVVFAWQQSKTLNVGTGK